MGVRERRRPDGAPSSVVIENVAPRLDCGRYPVKREVGDRFVVSADIFKDGHDKLAAVVRYRTREEPTWREAEMRFVDNDRWSGAFDLTEKYPLPLLHPGLPGCLSHPGATGWRRRSRPARRSGWSCARGS
jgi:hypothetical protein